MAFSRALLWASLPCAWGLEGDLKSSVLRDKVNTWESEKKDGEPVQTLVAAAQGAMDGPLLATKLFDSSGNFPALSGIPMAVGVIKLGNDGNGGCGVVPFHSHPNCFEVMTTLEGTGAYGQIRPDGTVSHSRVFHPGDTWVMEVSAQHYYRNLDPQGTWTFEIAFTCSEVIGESSWKWVSYLHPLLAQQFWSLKPHVAQALVKPQDPNLVKSSTRFIAQCANDKQLHENVGTKDAALFINTPSFTPSDQGRGGNIAYYTMPTPDGLEGSTTGMSTGRMTLKPRGMQNPSVCHNAHSLVHVIDGDELLVAQLTYDSKLAVEILNRHDVLVIPKGNVYFMLNMGRKEAKLHIHYNTQGRAGDKVEHEPRLSVLSNFFAQAKGNLIKAVLQLDSQAVADALHAAPDNMKLFKMWKQGGGFGEIKTWARDVERYCPLGCSNSREIELSPLGFSALPPGLTASTDNTDKTNILKENGWLAGWLALLGVAMMACSSSLSKFRRAQYGQRLPLTQQE